MNPTVDLARLETTLGSPELSRLLDALQRRIELSRPLTGGLTLASASTDERAAIDALFGRKSTRGSALRVDLDLLADTLHEAGICDDLSAAVGALRGRVVDRRAWRTLAGRLLAEAGVDAATLGRALNAVRDAWFERNPTDWLRHHAFYPGVCARVVQALDTGVHVSVVTTKAERFARALLEAAHPRLAAVPIVGREPGRAVAKPETLLRLAEAHTLRNDGADLWFVEDLLETLEAMAATPRLGRARLFLAAWGYNTLEQRAAAAMRPRLAVLSLAGFAEPFARWPS